ncbi:MAG: hypothetical protein NTW80_09575 [Deltaproteobacteria bacterium]|nr:hypothetical protein [Deltaproteobacteria bacterium]
MDDERVLAVQALEAAFEAIKAKHQGIHACYSTKSDPLLLELADMILLLSAQVTLAVAAQVNCQAAENRSKHLLH